MKLHQIISAFFAFSSVFLWPCQVMADAILNGEKSLAGICDLVVMNVPGKDVNQFKFEDILYDFVGFDKRRDSEQNLREKLQKSWIEKREKMICDSPIFERRKTHLLFYAIGMRSYDFLDKVAKQWNLYLNFIDRSDSKTPLDYLDLLKDRYSGTEDEVIFSAYIKRFERAGAKRFKDLDKAEMIYVGG